MGSRVETDTSVAVNMNKQQCLFSGAWDLLNMFLSNNSWDEIIHGQGLCRKSIVSSVSSKGSSLNYDCASVVKQALVIFGHGTALNLPAYLLICVNVAQFALESLVGAFVFFLAGLCVAQASPFTPSHAQKEVDRRFREGRKESKGGS